MRSIRYRDIVFQDPPPVDIPGERVHFPIEALFGCWMYQHQTRLMDILFATEGMSFTDLALDAFQHYPEVIEFGDAGCGGIKYL